MNANLRCAVWCFAMACASGEPERPAPPPAVFTLTTNTFFRGQEALITVEGAPPASQVHLVVSASRSSQPWCPPQLGGTCLDIPDPATYLGSQRTDATGRVEWALPLPASFGAPEVHLQAGTSNGAGGFVFTEAVTVPVYATDARRDSFALVAGGGSRTTPDTQLVLAVGDPITSPIQSLAVVGAGSTFLELP